VRRREETVQTRGSSQGRRYAPRALSYVASHERDAQTEREREREREKERKGEKIGARYTHVILEDDNEGFNRGLAVVGGVVERAK